MATKTSAPVATVSNPRRIRGIKTAFVEAVALKAGDHDWVADHVRYLFMMPEGAEIDVTASEGGQKLLDDAAAYAKKVVPDWEKLPSHEAIGLKYIGNAPKAPRKQKQLESPKVVTNHIRVTRWSDAPISQIAQVLEAEERKLQAQPAPPAPKPAAVQRHGIRTLPTKVDIASAHRMGALIGR